MLTNEFLCAKVPRVASGQRIMVSSDDLSAEIEVVRHIASIFVKQ